MKGRVRCIPSRNAMPLIYLFLRAMNSILRQNLKNKIQKNQFLKQVLLYFKYSRVISFSKSHFHFSSHFLHEIKVSTSVCGFGGFFQKPKAQVVKMCLAKGKLLGLKLGYLSVFDTVSCLFRLPCCCWKMEQTPMLLTSWIPPPFTGRQLKATTVSSSCFSNRAPQRTSKTRRAIHHCMCLEKRGVFPLPFSGVCHVLVKFFTFIAVQWNVHMGLGSILV